MTPRKERNRPQGGRAARGTARGGLGTLLAGALGLGGFALAVLAGLIARNDSSQILSRAIVTSLVLAAVGGLAGRIAGRAIREGIRRPQDGSTTDEDADSIKTDQPPDSNGSAGPLEGAAGAQKS